MSKFRNRLMKRMMAMILSGVMVLSVSGAPVSGMTVFASEALEDTGGGYDEEESSVETVETESTSIEESETTDSETTSETESSLYMDEEDIVKSTTEDEEKEVKDEDVKSGTLLEMESGSTYIFNVNDMEAFAASSENEGKQILSSDGYFALICGASTVIDANRNDKSYTITDEKQAKSETFTKRLTTGGNPTTGRQSIQFKTKSGVDVTVYWMSKGTSESPRQMSILDADGTKKTETQVITTFSNSMYVSTMTLDDAGTYYLGGNNYIYKVIVEPKKNTTETQIPTTWDFSDKTKFPEMKLDTTKGTEQGFQTCALEYCGLQVDTNKNNNDVLQTGNAGGGKFYVKSDTNVQTNQNTIIRIPIEGKSKVTLTMHSGAETYKVDGETAGNGKTQSFICNGENGYATLTIIKTGEYLQKIEVKKLSKVTVSGSVTTTPEKTDAYQVVFTDKKSKEIITADVTGGSYTAQLYENAAYTVSLSDKNYNVTEGAEITIAENATTVPALNITATAMSTETVEGTVTFPTTIPSDLKLTFKEKDGVHTVSDIEITTKDNVNKYSADLQSGKTYTVTATGTRINDYELVSDEVTSSSPNLAFKAKETYAITVTAESFDKKITSLPYDLTFINKNDKDYTYDVKKTDSIQLRDGTYSMTMDVAYPYMFDFTQTLTVNGAAKTLALNFTERMAWDFTNKNDIMLKEGVIKEKQEADQPYNGLIINTAGNGKFGVDTSNKGQVQVNNGTTVKIPVSGKGKIQIVTSGADYTFYKLGTMDAKGVDAEYDYDVGTENEEQQYVTLTSTGGLYLKKIIVTRDKAIIPTGPRKIDVWDFGAKEETDTDKYTNNITPATWLEPDLWDRGDVNKVEKNVFKSSTYNFGDLAILCDKGDRLYSNLDSLKDVVCDTASNGSNNDYKNGYTAAGAWYCNNPGNKDKKTITIQNVVAGDKIVLYAGQHASGSVGPITYHFDGQDAARAQQDSASLDSAGRAFKKFEFIAAYSGTYKIWPECENNGKPMYHRVMRIPGVKVSGTIDFGAYTGSGHTVKFVNETTGAESVAKLDGTSFEVSLASGYTYTALLSGAPGYGFASEGKTVQPTENDIKDGITNVSLKVEAKDMYTYSGKLTGFATDYDTSRLSITMTPPEDSTADRVRLTIDENLNFTAQLDLDVEYTIQMEGVDDYVVSSDSVVKSTTDVSADITVALKPQYTATGGFIGLENATVTKLTFVLLDETGKEDSNYGYPATIANGSYSAKLRDGAYIAKAEVSGYTTRSHVVVDGKDAYKDLLFVPPVDNSPLEKVANLYVGYPGKKNNFKTVNAAVKAATRMNPSSESERITIHIAPGTYREQIKVDVPYITFTNDEAPKKVLITWYYGIGYKYYSADATGWYNEECAFDKCQKNGGMSGDVARWGVTVNLTGKATAFRAENIIFENSFNRYITEEELEDGVENAGTTCSFKRETGADVQSKAATERAAALYIDNTEHVEFYKCSFHSSQDTLGTGGESGAKNHAYFKDCLIEGNTDYICGDGDIVFDNCELRFAGYSTGSVGGYLTAAQGKKSEHGYLFWNCTVTGNKELTVVPGYLGRPWREKAKVIFVNTKLENANLIEPKGWTSMSDVEPTADTVVFKEYNTMMMDGTAADTSGRVTGVVTENPVSDMTVYFDGWTPTFLTYDESKVVREPISSEKRSDVETGTTITLSCATADAKIYYTTNGEDPTGADSELYTAGTQISLGDEEKTVTIKAVAIKGDIRSSIAIFEYHVLSQENLIAAPTATVEPGKVDAGTVVLLNCTTQGAEIYYTTNGDEPTVKSELLYRNQPIVINQTMTIKAIAAKDTNVSSLVSFAYEVENKPPVGPEDPDDPNKPPVGPDDPDDPNKPDVPADPDDPNKPPVGPDDPNKPDVPADPDDPGKDKTDIWITGLEKPFAYTGAKIIPDIKVWDCDIAGNDRLLILGVDYTVAYKDNAKAGTATVIVTGKGNYVGKDVKGTFSIEAAKDENVKELKNLKGAKIAKIADVEYTGEAIYPEEFTLTMKNESTTYARVSGTNKYTIKGKDEMNVYVAVSNNINKGSATILVTGEEVKGKATSAKATFKITPVDLSKASTTDLSIDVPKEAEYAVNGAMPKVTVTYKGTPLKNGRDYTVKYANNKKIGSKPATVTVIGKGNYVKKCAPIDYTIKPLNMLELKVNAVTACDKIKAGKIKATVVDKDGIALKPAQYTLDIYKEKEGDAVYGAADELKEGDTIYVAATAKDTVSLTGSTPRAEFKVGKDISKAKITLTGAKKGIPYTGSEIKLKDEDLTVTMKGVTGNLELKPEENPVEGKNYAYEIVSYSNNINKGTATAVIKGIGEYSGTKTIKFKITQKPMVQGKK